MRAHLPRADLGIRLSSTSLRQNDGDRRDRQPSSLEARLTGKRQDMVVLAGITLPL